MKKAILAILLLSTALLAAAPAMADHIRVGIGVGGYYGGGGYYGPRYGYWDPYYPAYYPGYYPYYYYSAPPPPVVYAAPPASVSAPATTYAPPSVNPASATYTDSSGRTCREFQSSAQIDGRQQPTYGTACLQPDGSWRVVGE